MFATLQSEIVSRIYDTEQFVASTVAPGLSRDFSTAKGLAFVQLYAVYEYTVRGIVQGAISAMKADGLLLKDTRFELLGLVLNSETDAIADCGPKRKWRKRMELFRQCDAPRLIVADDATFPNDGSHFRKKQLETIWELFGISAPIIPDPRLIPRIDEVVEHRNAIAHGRMTAVEVGRRFSAGDIRKRCCDWQAICLHLVSTMDHHCLSPVNFRR